MPDAAPWLGPEHEEFRRALRAVVERELAPHADEWEAAGIFPREIYGLMGKLGYLGLRYAPEYGGAGLDFWYTLILAQELVKCGSVGTAVGLLAHTEFALSGLAPRGAPGRRRLGHQRVEDLHHQRHARRLRLAGRAHRRARAEWAVGDPSPLRH